jgi:NitT/TauT family transport system permease protein/sulfonate transport system permease protein
MIKEIAYLLSILLVIQLFFSVFRQHIFIFPSPIEVLEAFIAQLQQRTLVIDVLMSLQRVILGFVFATVIAIPLAVFCGHNRLFGGFVKPFIEILRPIPPIAWIPIAILIFGLGDMSAYFIVFMGAFFPIFTNSFWGINSLPIIYQNVASSFEIKRFIFIKDILLKFSLPYIFTGLKIGIGMAWMSVIAAELIGAQSGLGYFIQMNRLLLRIDNVVLGMILIGIIGYSLIKILSILEEVFMPWIKKSIINNDFYGRT